MVLVVLFLVVVLATVVPHGLDVLVLALGVVHFGVVVAALTS